MTKQEDKSLSTPIITEKEKQLFLDDLMELYKKHNISIAHQDFHGAFIIERLNEYDVNWINDAYIENN